MIRDSSLHAHLHECLSVPAFVLAFKEAVFIFSCCHLTRSLTPADARKGMVPMAEVKVALGEARTLSRTKMEQVGGSVRCKAEIYPSISLLV